MANLTPWMLLLAGLLVGLLLGGLIGLLALRRDGDDGKARDLREELDAYRDQVASHYAETAKRVDALTQAYKSVYDHLEQGAYRLVGEEELRERLDDSASDPVTLEGIGQRALDAASVPRADREEDVGAEEDVAADERDADEGDDERRHRS